MRDKFTSLESDRRSSKPHPVDGTRRQGDIDRMVSSFLSELNILSDDFDKPAEEGNSVAIDADNSDPVDAQPEILKPVSYRNIDVLLMHKNQFPAVQERAREEAHSDIGLFESQSPAHSSRARRRRICMLILSAASVTLLGTVGVLYLSGYFESMPSGKREDIAAPSRILASSLIRGGTAAPLAQTISAAVAIEKVAPRYAPGAKKLRVKATVELDAEVDAHGEVVSALAVSGPIALRPAATEALLKWRFRPARRNGSDVKSTARVSIVFDRR